MPIAGNSQSHELRSMYLATCMSQHVSRDMYFAACISSGAPLRVLFARPASFRGSKPKSAVSADSPAVCWRTTSRLTQDNRHAGDRVSEPIQKTPMRETMNTINGGYPISATSPKAQATVCGRAWYRTPLQRFRVQQGLLPLKIAVSPAHSISRFTRQEPEDVWCGKFQAKPFCPGQLEKNPMQKNTLGSIGRDVANIHLHIHLDNCRIVD